MHSLCWSEATLLVCVNWYISLFHPQHFLMVHVVCWTDMPEYTVSFICLVRVCVVVYSIFKVTMGFREAQFLTAHLEVMGLRIDKGLTSNFGWCSMAPS